MSTEPTPEEDRREFLNRLFATATAMLEDAIDMSIAGQAPRRSVRELGHYGHRLAALAREIATVSEAAKAIAKSSTTQRSEEFESSG